MVRPSRKGFVGQVGVPSDRIRKQESRSQSESKLRFLCYLLFSIRLCDFATLRELFRLRLELNGFSVSSVTSCSKIRLRVFATLREIILPSLTLRGRARERFPNFPFLPILNSNF